MSKCFREIHRSVFHCLRQGRYPPATLSSLQELAQDHRSSSRKTEQSNQATDNPRRFLL